MDILKRIENLRLQRGWSIYRLADESCLTQSTIQNMYKRKTSPTIKTLTLICDAFGITLSQFFQTEEDSEFINEEEAQLLYGYRKLDNKGKKIVSDLINYI